MLVWEGLLVSGIVKKGEGKRFLIPTGLFKILELHDQVIHGSYVVQEHPATDFEAQKL